MAIVTRRNFLAQQAALLTARLQVRPNILFIFSDDQHFQTLSAAGNPHIRTPNLDRLASRGVRFTDGIISTPQCAPSRGIILSGRESCQNGLISNKEPRFPAGRPGTIVEQLRRSGYDTAMIGKFHNLETPEECGFTRAPLWFHGGGMRYIDPELQRGLKAPKETVPGHITNLLTDAAVDYVRAARDPFFLWLCYNAPHSTLVAPDRFLKRFAGVDPAKIAPPFHPPGGKPYDWATYYAVIEHLDDCVGRLIRTLEQQKLWDRTLVLFVGDNGWMGGTRNWAGKVVPYEESIRVPFVAAGAGVRPGVVSRACVASVDLPATFLDVAGVRPEQPLAGRSLKRLLAEGTGGPTESYAVWDDSRVGALSGNRAVEAYRLVRTTKQKYILWESGREECYDLERDPVETRNLPVPPELRQKLVARMESMNDRALGWRR